MGEEVVKQGWDCFTQYGFAGLFVFVFLALCVLFVLTVRMFLRKDAAVQRETINAIKDATTAQRDCAETLEDVKKSLDESTRQSAEALNYMRIRDSFFGKGPRS